MSCSLGLVKILFVLCLIFVLLYLLCKLFSPSRSFCSDAVEKKKKTLLNIKGSWNDSVSSFYLIMKQFDRSSAIGFSLKDESLWGKLDLPYGRGGHKPNRSPWQWPHRSQCLNGYKALWIQSKWTFGTKLKHFKRLLSFCVISKAKITQ